MGFQKFLDDNKVTDIDPVFSEVMDDVGAPIVIAAFGVAGGVGPAGAALPSTSLAIAVPIALAAKQGAGPEAAKGAALLMTALATDIDTQIGAKLTAGAANLAIVPPGLGGPAGPVKPVALAAGPSMLNPKFGKAALQWAVSLLPSPDLRVISPFTA